MQLLEQVVMRHVFQESDVDLGRLGLAIGLDPLKSIGEFHGAMQRGDRRMSDGQRWILRSSEEKIHDRVWWKAALEERDPSVSDGEIMDLLHVRETVMSWGNEVTLSPGKDINVDELLGCVRFFFTTHPSILFFGRNLRDFWKEEKQMVS